MSKEYQGKRRGGLAALALAPLLALSLITTLGAVAAPPPPASTPDELTPEERAQIQKRMGELSQEMRELGRRLGDERRMRMFEDRRLLTDRAMLGLNVDDESSNAKGDGVHVAAVTPSGPAASAGLRAGDVLLSIDGKPLKKDGATTPYERLKAQMEGKKPGDEAKLKVLREGKTLELTVKTEAYAPRSFAFAFDGLGGLRDLEMLVPPMPPSAPGVPGFGPGMERFRWFARQWGDLEMVSLSPKLGEYFGAKEGVLVVHAPDDEGLKLQDGDVILKVGDRKPANPEQVLRILRSYDSGESLKLEVLRNRKTVSIDVTVPDRRTGLLRGERDGFEVLVSP